MKRPAFQSILRSLVFSLALAGPAFVTSWIVSSLDPSIDGVAMLRAAQIAREIPEISRGQRPIIVALGTSDIEINFSAEQVQSALEKRDQRARVYNFGVRRMGGAALRGLSESLAENFAGRGEIELTIIRFMPMYYTRISRKNLQHSNLDLLSRIYGGRFLARMLVTRPKEAIDLLFSKYIRLAGHQDYCSIALSLFLRGSISSIRPHNVDWAPLFQLWTNEKYFFNVDVPWDAKLHGDSRFDETPEFIQSYIEKNKEPICRESASFERDFFGYVDLEIDDESLAEFQDTVEILKKISKHVVVLYIPDYFCPNVPGRSAVGDRRLQLVLNWAKQRLDEVEFWDYSSKITADPVYHFDATHFTLEGRKRFNLSLAEDISRLIEKDAAK